MAINSVSLSGRLTRDAELKQAGYTTVCEFSIAVNERRKNRNTQEWEDVPGFFDVSMFGNYAASLAPHLLKGVKVFVDGKLHYASWQAQDGSKRSKVTINADTVETASQASAQNGAQGAFTPQNAQTYQPSYNAAATPATASRAYTQAQPSVPPMPQTPPTMPQTPQTPPAATQAPQQQAARPAVCTNPFEDNPFEQTLSATEMLAMAAADDLPF